MSQQSSNQRFRDAALAEAGASVSAGARFAQIAVEAGQAVYVDLSRVPEKNRLAVVAQIKQLVDCASGEASADGAKGAAPKVSS